MRIIDAYLLSSFSLAASPLSIEHQLGSLTFSECGIIPTGEYSATRGRMSCTIYILDGYELDFRLRYDRPTPPLNNVNDLDSSSLDIVHRLRYTVQDDCSLVVSEKDEMHEILNTLPETGFCEPEDIMGPFQFMPSVQAIRLASVVFSQKAVATNKSVDEALYNAYYVKHIAGITYLARFISPTELSLGVSITINNSPVKEVLISSILSYKLENSNTVRAVLKENTDLEEFSFLRKMFELAGGKELSGSIRLLRSLDLSSVSIGNLSLQIDSHVVGDEIFDSTDSENELHV